MHAWLLRTFILLCLLPGVVQAEPRGFASCVMDSGVQAAETTAPLPAQLVVPRDAPVGTVLFDTQGWLQGGTAKVTCGAPFLPGDLWLRKGFVSGAAVPGQPNVYPSGVPGIGIRVAWSRDSKSLPAQMSGGEFMNSPRTVEPMPHGRYAPANNWWVQLVKTGPISSGTYNYDIPNVEVHHHDVRTNILTFPPLAITFQARSCRLVDGRDYTHHLRSSSLGNFSGVGSTALPEDFTITLNCDRGLSVSYRIDGDPADDTTLKNQTGDGMAKGVGIQLLNRIGFGGPIRLGREVILPRANNSGDLSILLTARYRQVDPVITAGKVSALATITLFYR
ncbi:fimbrial protein [Pseudomonas tohonis]|uniref:Fimbrial protein n=1 Tax=Pseudomonas tohonis TaxID=2725477 RepID=A0ABQ4W243_9PSED|nr:fimbrial protein [Pseudomonas tohonis]GJN53525.1 fimbrial protein [Pseudomonas tohonis]